MCSQQFRCPSIEHICSDLCYVCISFPESRWIWWVQRALHESCSFRFPEHKLRSQYIWRVWATPFRFVQHVSTSDQQRQSVAGSTSAVNTRLCLVLVCWPGIGYTCTLLLRLQFISLSTVINQINQSIRHPFWGIGRQHDSARHSCPETISPTVSRCSQVLWRLLPDRGAMCVWVVLFSFSPVDYRLRLIVQCFTLACFRIVWPIHLQRLCRHLTYALPQPFITDDFRSPDTNDSS